jgi:hypothetical protein
MFGDPADARHRRIDPVRHSIPVVCFAAALALAGCGKKTQDVQASYVEANKYDSYLCSQLRDEAARVSQRATAVFGGQNIKATVGAALYWPTALVMGKPNASDEEVARLKGEMAAIEQASNARSCGIAFDHADPTAPRYDAGGVKPDARANIGASLYNLPPKSGLR